MNNTTTLVVTMIGSAAVSCAPIPHPQHIQLPYTSIPVLTNEPVPNTWNLPQLDRPSFAPTDANMSAARELMRSEERLKAKLILHVHDPSISLQLRQATARWYSDQIYTYNCEHHYHNNYGDCAKIGNYYPWEVK